MTRRRRRPQLARARRPVRWRHRSRRRPPSWRPASLAARRRTGPGLLRCWPVRPTSTLRRSSRAEQRVSTGAATAAVTAGTTTISPPVPTDTPSCPLMSASSPTGITSENTNANDPSAMATTAGQALRSPGPRLGADAAGQARRHHPVQHGAPARGGQPARRTGGLPAPGGEGAGTPPRQIAVALSHVQAPEAGGHVSRPRRAGHPLLGNIGDVSRNCQHDMSRNYQLGRLPACPVACLRAAAVGFRGAGAGASRRLTGAVSA